MKITMQPNRIPNLLLLIVLFALCAPAPLRAADAPASPNAAQLISVLQSGAASLQEKDAACAMLKRIGGAPAVPALAALLADENLSHSACYALESMSCPEAGQALLAALPKTKGLLQVGIIQSLAQRREAQAAPALIKLLSAPDPQVALAAASALGRIGGPDAPQALFAALSATRAADPAMAAKRAALCDALLAIANQALDQNDKPRAASIFKTLQASPAPDHLRLAAFQGLIRAADDARALELVRFGIQANDAPIQMAALQMARQLGNPKLTGLLCASLDQASPALQAALVEALRQRNDPSAAPSLISLIKANRDTTLTACAIAALGDLGDASAVACLAEAAARSDANQKKAARQALLDLRRGDASSAMVAQLASATPAAQSELVRALAGRGEKTVAPQLVRLAREGSGASRQAACQVLGQLSDATHLAALVDLVTEAKTEAARADAGAALRALCERLQAQGARFNSAPLITALSSESLAVRAALLTAASALVDPRVSDSIRRALDDPSADPSLKQAALNGLVETRDPGLLPDLLMVAGSTQDPAFKIKAVRGYLRLAGDQTVQFTPAQRVQALQRILPLAQRPEEKWLALSGLATAPVPESLQLALSMLDDAAARAEAAQAAIQLAVALQATHAAEVRAALNRVIAASTDDAQRQDAQRLLKQLDGLTGFITQWQVAGPYTKGPKRAAALFNTAFPPEKPASANIAWRPISAGTNPKKPWLVDLLKPLPGTVRVAYARTRIYSDKAQPARLEIGSDDGVKAWFNGERVIAHNYVGALRVGADKADITLKPGWNTLLLKVTQNNQMWEFCARIVRPDGSPLTGLRYDLAFAPNAVLVAKPEPAPAPAAEPTPAVPHKTPPQISYPTPVTFQKVKLDGAFRSEGVAVADFNNDGKLDVATGTMLYLGPDWKPVPMLGEPKEYPREKYSQEFYCFAEDIDRDGWLDLIVIGFPNQKTRWLKNPGAAGGVWREYLAIQKTGNESPDWLDIDKDGKKELVFGSPKGMALAQPGADPTQPWTIRVIAAPKQPNPGHGLGVGDINGDGRNDIVCPEGWWEAPSDPAQTPWPFHQVKFCEIPPAQMCVYDADGDGDADVISSGAHRYGMWWTEQTPQGWTIHEIDRNISQLHALHLADINRDGLLDLVTGKRFWAHMHNDEGIDDPAVICWFELKRENGRPSWIRHDIDVDSGVGLHVQILDINGDGLLDLAASHKKGVYLFLQQPVKKQ